jgi:origin recognition complex subunit 4
MPQSTFLPSPTIQSLISGTFYTTKSLPDLLAALYIPIATATISIAPSSDGRISEAPSLLLLPPSLPHIHLALLVCATRLEAIHSLTQFNFNIVYAHYIDLLKKSKLAASTSGAAASGLREWGRDVTLKAWEELVRWEVLVKVGGKDEGMGEDGRMYRIDINIEEVRWIVERLGTGVGEGLVRWCKEI